jgi:hypothetical protein
MVVLSGATMTSEFYQQAWVAVNWGRPPVQAAPGALRVGLTAVSSVL